MNLKRTRDLDISKEPFNFTKEIKDKVDYKNWVNYISNNENFIWYEDTSEGKEILNQLDSIPKDFIESYTCVLNKVRAFFNYNINKKNTMVVLAIRRIVKKLQYLLKTHQL